MATEEEKYSPEFLKEFERRWALMKERDRRWEEEYEALPEDEKRRLEEIFSDPFYERISDDPTGGHDDEI